MHELSIAISVLDAVEEESQRRGGARVAAVHVKLGPLSGVMAKALQSAYNRAREQTPLAECELVIEEVPILVFCPECRAERDVESIQHICCAVCGTPTPQVIRGRELEVTALEICQ